MMGGSRALSLSALDTCEAVEAPEITRVEFHDGLVWGYAGDRLAMTMPEHLLHGLRSPPSAGETRKAEEPIAAYRGPIKEGVWFCQRKGMGPHHALDRRVLVTDVYRDSVRFLFFTEAPEADWRTLPFSAFRRIVVGPVDPQPSLQKARLSLDGRVSLLLSATPHNHDSGDRAALIR